jgi:hypothetical protein
MLDFLADLLTFASHCHFLQVIMMSKEKAVKAGSDILSQNSIPSPAFPTDLTKVSKLLGLMQENLAAGAG